MMRQETIRLPSGRAWRIWRGGGEPADLLWLHGVRGVDPEDPVLAALGRRHSILAPVAPGLAELEELDDIADIHELVLEYDDLLRALRMGRVSIVGHSLGAMVAAELAAHFPDRVEALALLAPVGLWNEAYPVADLFARPAAEMDDMLWHDRAAREAHAARLAGAGIEDEAERMIATTRALAAATRFIWPIPDKGLRRRLRRIAAPSLCLFGAEDAFVPSRYAEDFAAGLTGSTVIVPGAGHMLTYEKPDAVIRHLGGLIAV